MWVKGKLVPSTDESNGPNSPHHCGVFVPHITVGFFFYCRPPLLPSLTSLPHFLTPSLTPSHFIVGTPSLTPSLSHTPSWAAPEEPKRHYTPLNSLWKGVLDAVRARARAKRSQNSGAAPEDTKRSLWKALLDAARARRSQSSGAAPEESKRH